MKQLKSLFYVTVMAVALICLIATTACSSDEPTFVVNNPDNSKTNNYELWFNISKSGFSDEQGTRSAASWEEGDKIYLLFNIDSLTTWGNAQYKDGKWKLDYEGTLKSNALSTCKAVFLEHAGDESGMIIALSDSTAIYEDLSGSYFLSGDTLSVTATLKPKTGRLRLKGNDKEEVKVYGISHYTSYDYFNGTYTTSIATITTSVNTDYTPYIYGAFADKNEPRLNVYNTSNGFTRIFSTSIFNAGESGYMTIPTSDSHDGWTKNVTLKVNGVEFTMIPVAYSNGNFLLAETETTNALYVAIMGSNEESNNLPKAGLSYNNWNTFLTSLSNSTSINFRFPSIEEWQFAYKGGSSSKGYQYSGSDIADDVAWYNDNSNGTIHEVKQLKPNELGFYDMSGNVDECTQYNNGYYMWFGGSYNDYANNGSSYSYHTANSANVNSYGGLRIALSY